MFPRFTSPRSTLPPSMSSRSLIALLPAAALVAGTVLLGGCDRQSQPAGQANSAAATTGASDATNGEAPAAPAPTATNAPGPAPASTAGVVDRTHKGETPPNVTFADPQDKAVTVASFKGKPLLLNLWATWCAPCVREMPTLDKLAADQAGRIRVVAVSQDLDGQPKVLPFFAAKGFKALQPYIDAQAALSVAYQANLPTTILYDATGHEVWRVSGGMDWTGPEAAKLLAEGA